MNYLIRLQLESCALESAQLASCPFYAFEIIFKEVRVKKVNYFFFWIEKGSKKKCETPNEPPSNTVKNSVYLLQPWDTFSR